MRGGWRIYEANQPSTSLVASGRLVMSSRWQSVAKGGSCAGSRLIPVPPSAPLESGSSSPTGGSKVLKQYILEGYAYFTLYISRLLKTYLSHFDS